MRVGQKSELLTALTEVDSSASPLAQQPVQTATPTKKVPEHFQPPKVQLKKVPQHAQLKKVPQHAQVTAREGLRLPRLEVAMGSAEFPSVRPSEVYSPPRGMLEQLQQAKKILVIGHVPPDGDCVGSALGLARALAAMGKTAHALIDDELPGNLRGMDPQGEVRRAADVDGDYDLVVLVDVCANDRIGGGKEALARAKNVAVIDHHQDRATLKKLGVGKHTKLEQWYAPSSSASMLTASLAENLFERTGIAPSREEWRGIALPMALGLYTDTSAFTRENTPRKSLGVFKHLVNEHLAGKTSAVRQILRFELSKDAKKLLAKSESTYDSDAGFAFLRARQEVIAEAQRLAPNAGMNDLRGFMLQLLDDVVRSYDVAVLLWETDKGVLVSTRSQKMGPALELAKHVSKELGGSGNGHPHMAGGYPPCTLDQAAAVVQTWLHNR